MMDETFLTTEEVLEYLQVNLRTVYRLIKAGKIPAVRVGRQWRFRRDDLIAYMERGPVAVAAAPPEALEEELFFFAEQLGQAEGAEPGEPGVDSRAGGRRRCGFGRAW